MQKGGRPQCRVYVSALNDVIYIYCYLGKGIRTRIRGFKVHVCVRKRGEGRSVECTPQCKRGYAAVWVYDPLPYRALNLHRDKKSLVRTGEKR